MSLTQNKKTKFFSNSLSFKKTIYEKVSKFLSKKASKTVTN
jgi:hypothetical protein